MKKTRKKKKKIQKNAYVSKIEPTVKLLKRTGEKKKFQMCISVPTHAKINPKRLSVGHNSPVLSQKNHDTAF